MIPHDWQSNEALTYSIYMKLFFRRNLPLGAPEDELWEGKNQTWWKKKYETYADNLRGLYRAARQVRGNKKKSQQIELLIAHYEKPHKGLELRANRANLPNIFRSYP